MQPQSAQTPIFNPNPSSNPLLPSQVPQKSYSFQKYSESYIVSTNKLIEFFTLHNMKNYMNFERKTKFQRELMEQILRQLREFLRKKAVREFEIMMAKDGDMEGGLRLEEKFQQFDEIFFRSLIMDKFQWKQPDRIQISPFETFDVEDQILNQLQSALAKAYAQL